VNTIQQHYGALLATAQITDEPFPTSPPHLVNSETALVELWMKGEELVCPFESMEEKAAYIHGGQGLLGRDAS